MNKECNSKTCPWWGGYGLSAGLRKLIHNPQEILGEYIKPGMWVLDIGCGMGFMAIPALEFVGESGKMVIVDLQKEMLDEAMRRMKRAQSYENVVAVQCRQNSLCIEEFHNQIDFAYAFMMVHEVQDKERLLCDIFQSLKKGGKLLIAEPLIHVSQKNFDETKYLALKVGFGVSRENKKINLCNTMILTKNQ